MTASVRPVFLRPVEFTYTGYAFNISGGSSYNDFPEGTWANVLSLAHSMFAHLWNDGVEITLGLTDDFKFSLTPSGDITIVWYNTDIRDAFGFTGASTVLLDGVPTVADYRPLYTWIPDFQRADQGGFSRNLQECASGVVSADGTWSGTSTRGSTVFYTTTNFGMELETNLLVDAYGSSEYTSARCLENFLVGCLTAQPESATSKSPKGFWYYPDINDAISDCVLSTTEPWSEANDNGVQFGHTDSPNTRVFCMTSPDQLQDLRNPSLPVGRVRYGSSFSFHTAPVPSGGWQYVDWDGV
jgi:hypothetical protein